VIQEDTQINYIESIVEDKKSLTDLNQMNSSIFSNSKSSSRNNNRKTGFEEKDDRAYNQGRKIIAYQRREIKMSFVEVK
jgi:hypothetical protein